MVCLSDDLATEGVIHMNGSRLTSWKEYWERKAGEACDVTLRSLIHTDGFDIGVSYMNEDAWSKVVASVVKQLDLQDEDYLLEVGCGSGAMLLPLSKRGTRVAGIDYSEALVEIASRAVPDAEITVCEARDAPFQDSTFTKILSHAVFQYFPSLCYAAEVLSEMLRVLGTSGRVLIMDVPKISRAPEAEQVREEELSTLHRQYYAESFFTDFAEQESIGIRVFDQDIAEYGNSPFRFNVLMWR